MRKVLLFVAVILLSGAAAYFSYSQTTRNVDVVLAKNKQNDPSTSKQTSANSGVSIVFDSYGFEPNQFRVPVGTKVTVKNESGASLLFQALPGQPNQLDSLNLGNIAPNQSKSFTINKEGSWQFQANNNPALRGDVSGTAQNQSSARLTQSELPTYDPSTHTLLINYNDYGFLPNEVTVPAGTKITIKNSTNEGGMDFEELSSDPTRDPALSLGLINKGQQRTFVLSNPGTYHYVNTWEKTDMGEITVK